MLTQGVGGSLAWWRDRYCQWIALDYVLAAPLSGKSLGPLVGGVCGIGTMLLPNSVERSGRSSKSSVLWKKRQT